MVTVHDRDFAQTKTPTAPACNRAQLRLAVRQLLNEPALAQTVRKRLGSIEDRSDERRYVSPNERCE